MHRSTMTGLKAGTKYYYRVGDENGGFSNVFWFTTMVENVGHSSDLRIAQIADMGN